MCTVDGWMDGWRRGPLKLSHTLTLRAPLLRCDAHHEYDIAWPQISTFLTYDLHLEMMLLSLAQGGGHLLPTLLHSAVSPVALWRLRADQ